MEPKPGSNGAGGGVGGGPGGKPARVVLTLEKRKAYWRANKMLIGTLLAIWAIVTFGCSILWVEWLNQFKFMGLPLGFWFAQQGSIVIFVVMLFFYAWRMDKLDRRYGVQE